MMSLADAGSQGTQQQKCQRRATEVIRHSRELKRTMKNAH